jgi:2-polyprenyl-6-methoxyphenol hydroxylase-like FAD-dependent oxidoreductase
MSNAVVIGAGPTGLATAMLLAQQGLEVVVLDRDDPAPSDAQRAWADWGRRSVAQFHQVHYLQPAGRALLEEHLPDVASQMVAAGAVRFNLAERRARFLPGGPDDVDFSTFETITTCRRPVLEFGFVAAARSCPGVEIRSNCPVTELLTGPEVIDGVPHVIGSRLRRATQCQAM